MPPKDPCPGQTCVPATVRMPVETCLPSRGRSQCAADNAPRTARTRRTTGVFLYREAAVAEHTTRRAADRVCEVAAIGAHDCNRRQQVKHHQVC